MIMYNQPTTGGPGNRLCNVTVSRYKKAYRAVLQQATEAVRVAEDVSFSHP